MKKSELLLRRILSFVLVAVTVLSFAACGGDENEGVASGEDTGAIADASVSEGESSVAESTEEVSEEESVADYVPLNYDVIKGIWLSQFDLGGTYMSGGKQANERTFRLICEKMFAGISENNFNTVIVQIRPNGDSFYPSEVYCPSHYVTGAHNVDFTYDPFAIMIEEAHKAGLSVHAWINPMRCMTAEQIVNVSTDYLLGQWYQDEALRAKYLYHNPDTTGNNYYYLNPAYPEVRAMVVDGVKEICTNYKVDAVHIDDYFYPTTNIEFDRNAFQELGSGQTRQKFRINNVNKMVSEMYTAIKEIKSDILFGISPAGNIPNNLQSLYADVTAWCSTPGYCDYIVPQVYWGFEESHRDSRFDICCQAWAELVTIPEVKLVIGMGLYR
ncbi:MAG: family 10 glycosylhydrolase, partial [Clostridia bacterium]|nr:family 10 glycosylhydrolase [Clostridia bacterium]